MRVCRKLLPVLIVGVLLLAAGVLIASTGSAGGGKQVFPTPPLLGKPPVTIPKTRAYWQAQRKDFNAVTSHSWLQAKWTGNDAAFAAARLRLQAEFAGAAQPQSLVAHYAEAARLSPHDALAQFNWGYALLHTTGSPAYEPVNSMNAFNPINIALAEATSPHCYDYDRLRYRIFYEGGGGLLCQFLAGMGKRLLQKDPQDFAVLYDQAMIYSDSPRAARRKAGYSLIQHMIKEFPTRPESYDALANWYFNKVWYEHDASAWQSGVANQEKAFALYPTTSPRRPQLLVVRQRFKMWLARRQAVGPGK